MIEYEICKYNPIEFKNRQEPSTTMQIPLRYIAISYKCFRVTTQYILLHLGDYVSKFLVPSGNWVTNVLLNATQ